MTLKTICILAFCVATAECAVCEGYLTEDLCTGCTSGGECQWTEADVRDGTFACVTGPDCANGGPAITSIDEFAGSCYDPTTHVVSCDVAESACAGHHYAPGFVGRDGCCHCREGCDASLETGTDCGASMPGHGDDGHAMPGHGDEVPGVGYDEPCQLQQIYPLYCSAAAADDASPAKGHHMMGGLYMPNGATPMHHGDYVGDAAMCTCEPAEDGGGHDHGGHGGHGDGPNLLEIAEADPELSTLVAAVQATGLSTSLTAFSPTLTLFAPTNAAFEALGQERLDYLLDPTNEDELAGIIKHHLGLDPIMSSSLREGMVLGTLQDCPVVVGTISPTVTVGGFRGAPDDIMATVTEADIEASNGVVHKIDAVLEPLPTVWDIINDSESDPALEQFERKLKKFNLDNNLQEYLPWTVFAPIDKAINDIPDWAIDVLGKQVFEYHLVEGVPPYSSADLADMDGKKIETRQGDKIKVKVENATGGVSLEDQVGQEADFVEVDMQACNGVVHAIDTTLLYKNDNSDTASRAGLAVAALVAALALLL